MTPAAMGGVSSPRPSQAIIRTGSRIIQRLFYMKKILYCLASIAPHAEMTDGTVSPTLMARAGTGGGQLPIIMTYQETTGTLSPGGHPGSYNGQDAYNDMLVTEVAHGEDDRVRGGG